jgi:hypothetical protein
MTLSESEVSFNRGRGVSISDLVLPQRIFHSRTESTAAANRIAAPLLPAAVRRRMHPARIEPARPLARRRPAGHQGHAAGVQYPSLLRRRLRLRQGPPPPATIPACRKLMFKLFHFHTTVSRPPQSLFTPARLCARALWPHPRATRTAQRAPRTRGQAHLEMDENYVHSNQDRCLGAPSPPLMRAST